MREEETAGGGVATRHAVTCSAMMWPSGIWGREGKGGVQWGVVAREGVEGVTSTLAHTLFTL